MAIVINSVIGGFGWVDLIWLVASTVWSQVSNYSQLSNNSCTEWWVKKTIIIKKKEKWKQLKRKMKAAKKKNEAANAPITFEEIVID